MSDLILYTTEDGRSQIQLRADLGTVWLTQLEMAERFQTSKQNIAKHLKAIFPEQELNQESVVNQRLTTAADGKNYRVADFGAHPIWNALRSILGWERSPVHRTSILYTACREFFSLTRLGNCQGMLDSSGIKTLLEKRLAPLARQ